MNNYYIFLEKYLLVEIIILLHLKKIKSNILNLNLNMLFLILLNTKSLIYLLNLYIYIFLVFKVFQFLLQCFNILLMLLCFNIIIIMENLLDFGSNLNILWNGLIRPILCSNYNIRFLMLLFSLKWLYNWLKIKKLLFIFIHGLTNNIIKLLV